MLKAKFRLCNPGEVANARAEIKKRIDTSSLNPETADFLYQQIETSFQQFEEQLQSDRRNTFSADRVFEGDGYKISVKVSSKQPGLLSKLFG